MKHLILAIYAQIFSHSLRISLGCQSEYYGKKLHTLYNGCNSGVPAPQQKASMCGRTSQSGYVSTKHIRALILNHILNWKQYKYNTFNVYLISFVIFCKFCKKKKCKCSLRILVAATCFKQVGTGTTQDWRVVLHFTNAYLEHSTGK